MRKLVTLVLLAIAALTISPALTANASTTSDPGTVALNWAETQTGKTYSYGSTGPWSYDCSGLVYTAFQHAGISLPRTTYGMLDSGHLIRTYHPVRGDLAFYGTGHVEFVTDWSGVTFGAHDWGQPVGWIHYGYGWVPTMFFEVR